MSDMERHYREIKDNNPNSILMFRLGDYYEMFYEDAVIVSHELGLKMTLRRSQGHECAFCSIPQCEADAHIAVLTSRGFKVAVCAER